MKHTQHIVPIKTNRNKFNNSIPFRVIFSGTFNRNIYYDLSSAYLKIKIRCKPEQLKCIEKTSNAADILTNYNDDFYMPTFNNTPVDYIGGFFSVYDDNGEELKFELNNINNEESGNHSALMEFLEKSPIEYSYNTHIRKLFNGQKGFNMRVSEGMSDYQYDRARYKQLKSFDNKYRFHKEDDGYYYTTMYIPFSQVLEPAHKMSLLRIYAAEFDFFFKDYNKFFNTSLPYISITGNKGTANTSTFGEGYVTRVESNASPESINNFAVGRKLLYAPGINSNFFKEEPCIVDCDMYIDEYCIETTEEMSQIGNNFFQPCVFQLDNHVIKMNPELPINKFKLEVPFKSSCCYYYFTYDDDNSHALRTDYLYLNPPKHVILKSLTGFSTPFPDYYNNSDALIDDNNEKTYKLAVTKKYAMPETRLYDELLYNLKKFNDPQIDFESWLQIHRIYSIDMNSDLHQSPDKNTFFFEIGLEHELANNVKLHIIFVRDYTN